MYKGNHTYKGKPLFHGAIINLDSIILINPLNHPKSQAVFNKIAKTGGYKGAIDKLACL